MSSSTIRILYNDCYGGFSFSPELEAAYKERTGRSLPNKYMGPASVRCDPVVLELFERLGSERASGMHSVLAVREIPALFEHYWSIEDYDGNETVQVDVNEAYADALHLFMDSGDSARLCDQYRAIKTATHRLMGSYGIGLREGEIAAPPILKRPSIVVEEAATPDDYTRAVGYSYFGIGD